MPSPTINDVASFWENNPLFTGESKYAQGSREFFKDHRNTYLTDYFADAFPHKLIVPSIPRDSKVLDLGCGIGFWTVELMLRGGFNVFFAADLTRNAVNLTKKRLELYGLKAELSVQNAENMTFKNENFDHVNCQGVIHHTPDTDRAISEIARVLKKGGTAHISVYYKNFMVRHWDKLSFIGQKFHRLIGLKGRGRERMLLNSSTEELVRSYDGENNPVGKCYSRDEILKAVKPYFTVENTFLCYFPNRALPFSIPGSIHRLLSRNMGFLIHMNLRKK